MPTRFSKKPTVLDIFCGAGGMSLGFKQAGCRILGGIDQSKYAVDTHHHNFSECKIKIGPTDIRELTDLEQLGIKAGEVDILIGGPPCQVFSRVGIGKMKNHLNRDITKDPRNFLYKEYVRFVRFYKPLFFVMENVDNLFNKKEVLRQICKELSQLGYDVDAEVLDASKFGVPQRRLRLFLVGARKELGLKSIFPKKSRRKAISVGDAISDLPMLKPFAIPLKTKSSGPKQIDNPQPYKNAPTTAYQRAMRRSCKGYVLNHLCRAHNHEDLKIFSMMKQGDKYRDLPQEVRRYRDDIFDDKYHRLVWDEPSWTLTAHMRKDCLAYIHPTQTRSISAREAARLQSFPDRFVFSAPMTRMFELIGNSVPPLLARAVAQPIVRKIKDYHSSKSIIDDFCQRHAAS